MVGKDHASLARIVLTGKKGLARSYMITIIITLTMVMEAAAEEGPMIKEIIRVDVDVEAALMVVINTTFHLNTIMVED